MFGFFKKKSEYVEVCRASIGSFYQITPSGIKFIEDHEKAKKNGPFFVAGMVFMNGVCNQLADEVGDGSSDPAGAMLKSLELTSKATAFLQGLLSLPEEEGLISRKEQAALIELLTEITTEPGHRFHYVLSLGKLAA